MYVHTALFLILADLELNGLESGNGDEEAVGEPRRLSSRRSVLTSPVANGVSLDYDGLGKTCRSLPSLALSGDSLPLTLAGVPRMAKCGIPSVARKDRQVHLTHFELEGLRCLVDKLESATAQEMRPYRDRRTKTLSLLM